MTVSGASGRLDMTEMYVVWSFLPDPSWFDKHTLVSTPSFLMIHWQ